MNIHQQSLNKAKLLTKLEKEISKIKNKLITQAENGCYGENFGQHEVRKLDSKYFDIRYTWNESRTYQGIDFINNFDNWCSTYEPNLHCLYSHCLKSN